MSAPAPASDTIGTGAGRHILIAHPSPDLYGSDLQLLETVTALRRDGWTTEVVLPTMGPLHDLLRERGATVRTVPFPVLRKADLRPARMTALATATVRATTRLARLTRDSGASAVYVNTVTIPVWIAAARLARRPVLCHVHEAEAALPRILRTVLAAPLLGAGEVVTNSAAARDVLVGAIPSLAGKVMIVHNGVPDDPRGPAPVRPRAAPSLTLALVGRLSPRKGTDVALEAVALLRRRGRDVSLDICGTAFPGYEWYEEDLLERAAQADLSGAVRFHGYVSRPRALLDAADVVLVPSRVEPFGNTAVEGLLAGRPVVASRVQGLTEVIRDGRTGLLVPPCSPEGLADAVERLADDHALSRRLAEAGRDDALDRFSVETYHQRISAAVGALCPRNP